MFDFDSFKELQEKGAQKVELDQCMYKAPTTKPTQVLYYGADFEQLRATCTHDYAHRSVVGLKDENGLFMTRFMAAYPPELNDKLAKIMFQSGQAKDDPEESLNVAQPEGTSHDQEPSGYETCTFLYPITEEEIQFEIQHQQALEEMFQEEGIKLDVWKPKSKTDGEAMSEPSADMGEPTQETSGYETCTLLYPITEEEKISADYLQGVSCPHCIDSYSDEQRERFKQRELQMQLAKHRGEDHLGADVKETVERHRQDKIRFREEQRSKN